VNKLPHDGRENCGCHAHNHPSDEQGVDGKLNQPTLLDYALLSALKGSREKSDQALRIELRDSPQNPRITAPACNAVAASA